MTNTASILVLLFLAVTFVQSAYDKIFGWQGNIDWLKEHFANTSLLKNNVTLALTVILILELITGVLTLVGQTGCLQANGSGVVSGTGVNCGLGSGSAGTWATTTSTHSGRLINYSLNDSDIITIGSNSTTTSEFYFDPNLQLAKIPYASSTYQSFITASTTNLIINGESFNDLTGTGLAISGNSLVTSNIPNASLS